MAEFEFDIRDLYRVFRHRRWVILLSPALVGLLTFVLMEKEPPVYQAESLVKISRVAANMQALLVEALSWYQGDNIATQSQIITSQKVKAALAVRLADRYPDYRGFAELSPLVEAAEYDQLEQRVRADPGMVELVSAIEIETERKEDSDIVGILARAGQPRLAIDIANLAAQEYARFNSAEKNSQVREAVRFIESKMGDTRGELSQAEEALQEFRRENALLLGEEVEQVDDLVSQIETLNRRMDGLDKAVLQLEVIGSIDQFLSLYPALTDLEDPVVSRLQQQLFQLHSEIGKVESERQDLLSYRTEESPEVRSKIRARSELERQARELMSSLVERYQKIRADLDSQRRALYDRRRRMERAPEVFRELESLQRQVQLKTEALNLLQGRFQDAQIQSAGEIKEVFIVEQASAAPGLPRTSEIIKVLVGMIIGLILGGVFAIVSESLDTSIGTIEDVERYLGLPVLGVIPHLDRDSVREKVDLEHLGDVPPSEVERMTTLCAHFTPSEPVTEAFRSLKAQLDIPLQREGMKTVLVTSSVLQEGKTNTASNLAVVFAQSGRRTLLIDADLRRPQIHKAFGLKESPGLSDVLLGVEEPDQAVRGINDLVLGKFGLKNSHFTPGLEYLFLMTSGRKVENPAELLSLERSKKLFTSLREQYDVVVVDAAPVLPVADSSLLAPMLDVSLLAYQIGRAGREVVARSKTRLESVGGNVVGVVMNDIEAEIYHTRDYEYYGYKYRYEEVPSDASPGGLGRRLLRFFGIRRSGPRQWEQPGGGSSASGETRDIMNLTKED